MDNIGQKIKEARVRNCLTQEQLAILVGCSQRTVSDWEVERHNIPLPKLKKLSKVLKTKITHFLSEDGEKEE